MVGNGWDWSGMGGNAGECWKMVEKGWEWLVMGGNG